MFRKVVQATGVAVLLAFGATRAVQAEPSSLMAARSCSALGMELTIAWTNSASAVLQQYVDVSAENNGWVPGTFQLNGPLNASANSIVVSGLSLSAPYYVRVNQLLGNGNWEASDTLTVTPSNASASTCGPSAPIATVAPAMPAAPDPVASIANAPAPTNLAASGPSISIPGPAPVLPPPGFATTAPGTTPAVLQSGPPELTSWLQSIGVLSQPTIYSFVRDAVAAFQQPPIVPGMTP